MNTCLFFFEPMACVVSQRAYAFGATQAKVPPTFPGA